MMNRSVLVLGVVLLFAAQAGFAQEMGACCIEGECLPPGGVMTYDECLALGGDWYGGESCLDFECPQPLGACCVGEPPFAPQCVATTTQAECETTWYGEWYPGETCPEYLCPCDDDEIAILIQTDYHPEEITWALYEQADPDPILIASGGPLQVPYNLYGWRICVDSTKCYDAYIYDSAGDGLDPGQWIVALNGVEVYYNYTWRSDVDTTKVGSNCPWACCIEGVCVSDETEADCIAMGGEWYEDELCEPAGTEAPFECPWPDFVVTAPYVSPQVENTYEGDMDCDLRYTYDHTYLVTIPWESDWSINTCLYYPDGGFDTMLYVGSDLCLDDIGWDDNGCGATKDEVVVHLTPGDVHVAVEARAGIGQYKLEIKDLCPEDLDSSGKVDLSDLAALLANYGKTGMGPRDGDFDGSGKVDLSDLAQLLSVYGQFCPTH